MSKKRKNTKDIRKNGHWRWKLALSAIILLVTALLWISSGEEQVSLSAKTFQELEFSTTESGWRTLEELGIVRHLETQSAYVKQLMSCDNTDVVSINVTDKFAIPGVSASYIDGVLSVRTSPGTEGYAADIRHELVHVCTKVYPAPKGVWSLDEQGNYVQAREMFGFSALYWEGDDYENATLVGGRLTEGVTSFVAADRSYSEYQQYVSGLMQVAGYTSIEQARPVLAKYLSEAGSLEAGTGVFGFCKEVIPTCNMVDLFWIMYVPGSPEWDELGDIKSRLFYLEEQINRSRRDNGLAEVSFNLTK